MKAPFSPVPRAHLSHFPVSLCLFLTFFLRSEVEAGLILPILTTISSFVPILAFDQRQPHFYFFQHLLKVRGKIEETGIFSGTK